MYMRQQPWQNCSHHWWVLDAHDVLRTTLPSSLVYRIEILSWKKNYDKPRQHIEKQRCHFADKGLSSQSYGFSSYHVRMWDVGYKEAWAPKNWCFWTVMLEKILESPLGSKEIKQVNPKGNQPWISSGRTDAEAEAPILWPPGAKSWLIAKDPDAGRDCRQEEKGETGWDGWMASSTQWTWIWANSRR